MKAAGINWHEWNENTFKLATQKKKLILLDISATWCHWCHRLDKDTYSNPNVIKKINENFIPVRVDTDKRPDINERYNVGGWPTTVVLTHEGFPISGATYLPPDNMINFLDSAEDTYKKYGTDTFKRKKDTEELKSESVVNKISIDTVKEFLGNLLNIYDEIYGGFGYDQKFPMPDILQFIITYLEFEKSNQIQKILTNTLDNMASAVLFDKEEGGFFRYSVTRDWNTPHYEKMLEDNSQLIEIFLKTFKITNNEKYKEVALKILDYIFNSIFDKEQNYFYSSQDADEEYYKLNLSERKKKKSPFVDKTAYTDKNAMMIIALLNASEILGDEKYLNVALKVIDFIFKNSIDEIVKHYTNSKEGILLRDHAYLLSALTSAYEKIKDKDVLAKINKLIQIIVKNFQDNDGVFFDLITNEDSFGLLSQKLKKAEENLLLGKVFLKLYALTKDSKYPENTKSILDYFSKIELNNLALANFCETLLIYLNSKF